MLWIDIVGYSLFWILIGGLLTELARTLDFSPRVLVLIPVFWPLVIVGYFIWVFYRGIVHNDLGKK